ncbi:MAG: 16S rRNA (cytosine(1402)-N(4))-methyltransferase RsmH [Myxococcota bacterium]
MMAAHQPVMVASVMQLLSPRPGARIIDATLGLGGHAEIILQAIGPQGRLIGVDRDPEMLHRAGERLRGQAGAVKLVHARFSSVSDVAPDLEPCDGILMDLGLCSAQLDAPERGFSFSPDDLSAPLDMRMDRRCGETAAELLDRVDEVELTARLREGDVPAARRVARALLEARPLHTVQELNTVLARLPRSRRRHHPATLVYQALRLAVNDELDELDRALERAVELLVPGGRLVLIAYHSGEDRRVKRFLAREERGCICPPDLPRCGCGRSPRLKTLTRVLRPGPDELLRNPRARSARLRGAERR